MVSARTSNTSDVPDDTASRRTRMRKYNGSTFIILPYEILPGSSQMRFKYETLLKDGSSVSFVDVVTFHGATPDMWQRVPDALLKSIAESLSIMLGINYWMPHAAPEIRIEGFSLTKQQADFWNELYTKGLGEFFYAENIDFHGRIAFPYTDDLSAVATTPLPYLAGTLLANGGGKDTVVSAELLREHDIPFTLFEWRARTSQKAIAKVMNVPTIEVTRQWDRSLAQMCLEDPYEFAFPVISTLTFFATCAAALHGFRYIVLSNESSSDIANVEHHGLSVNHQWSKSTEAELLIQKYISTYISPDIVHFSLLRPFTELETTRRFSKYPNYFSSFSSCNRVFSRRRAPAKSPEHGFWCGRCAKCVFIFASLSACINRQTVVDIIGADLYADTELLPMFRTLLGIEGEKPFDCVGSPEEMIVAMHAASESGAYRGEPAMQILDAAIARSGKTIEDMRCEVFALASSPRIPEIFASCHHDTSRSKGYMSLVGSDLSIQ